MWIQCLLTTDHPINTWVNNKQYTFLAYDDTPDNLEDPHVMLCDIEEKDVVHFLNNSLYAVWEKKVPSRAIDDRHKKDASARIALLAGKSPFEKE